MDTTKGELSFVVSGVNLGVAYDGIPLDKPLVPVSFFTTKVIQWNWTHLKWRRQPQTTNLFSPVKKLTNQFSHFKKPVKNFNNQKEERKKERKA